MFGTLRIGSSKDDTHYQAHTDQIGDISGNLAVLPACDTCRARKLRCDGNKQGCQRCQQTGTFCHFSGPPSKRKARYTRRSSGQTNPTIPPQSKLGRKHQQRRVSLDTSSTSPGPESSNPSYDSRRRDESAMRLFQDALPEHGENSIVCTTTDPSSSCGYDDHGPEMIGFDQLDQAFWDFADSPQPALSDHSDAFSWPLRHPNAELEIMDTLQDVPSMSASLKLTHDYNANSMPENIDFPSSDRRTDSQTQDAGQSPAFRRISTFAKKPDRRNEDCAPMHEKQNALPCNCSAAVLKLLDEPCQGPTATSTESIDGQLAAQQKILSSCFTMLDCAHCVSLADHMMVLAFACRRAVSFLERMMHFSRSWTKSRTLRRRDSYTESEDLSQMSIPEHGNMPRIQFGSFEVIGTHNKAEIMSLLLRTQLRATMQLVCKLRTHAEKTVRTAQLGILTEAGGKLQAMAKSFHFAP